MWKAAQDRAKQMEKEIFFHCAEICSNPTAIPIGTMLMADQAKLLFVDSNMHQYPREDYIKNHGLILYPSGEQSRSGVKRDNPERRTYYYNKKNSDNKEKSI